MNTSLSTHKHKILSLAIFALLNPLAFNALAQSDSAISAIEEISVTGSRIPRRDLTANSPISVIDQEIIRSANVTNMEEFLRDQPQFVAGVGANSNNGNDGSATVDLRNLGEERTLVLVDGKRFTPYDYQGFVDLGMIPTSLVSRVEIVTGGASAVYGTDAVAGVVNFIMNDEFEGVEFNVSTSQTGENDAKRQDYSLTLGKNFADGRGNIVFNMGYTDQDALTQAERPFGEETLDDLLSPVGSATVPGGSVADGSFPGDAEEGFVQFDPMGNTVSFFNTFNFNPFNLYQTPQKKQTATILGHFDFTDSLTGFTRISYAKNEINTIIAPTGTFFNNYSIDYLNNPYLGAGAVARFTTVDNNECDDPVFDANDVLVGCNALAATAGDGIVDISFGRRLTELGTRDSLYENEATQFVFGLNGNLGETMEWEAFAQYGKTDRTQAFLNDVSSARVTEALSAVDNGGTIECSSGNPACSPANLFGAGNLSQAAAQYIRLDLSEVNDTEQFVLGATLTGETGFTIPSAELPLSYSFGFEYRNDEAQNKPDANYDVYSGGDSIGFGTSSPVDSELKIKEVFGELMIPVLDNVNIEAGVRFAQYENTANTVTGKFNNDFDNTSYKIGGDWTIVEGLRARAMFQHAVRAPNLSEIGLPLTPSTGDLNVDPCEGSNPVGNPQLTALCIATGVPAGSIGTVNSIISGQINNFLGGDPNLEPEEADTYTLGLVYTPSNIPGLELSLDYYDITIENVITQLAEQEVVNGCYNQEQVATGPLCSRIFRNPLNGSLQGGNDTGVSVSLLNSAEESVNGIDFAANYALDFENAGSLKLALLGTYTFEHEFQSAKGTAAYDCVGLVGNTCISPDPKFRWTQTTTWEFEEFQLNLTWRYLDDLQQDEIKLGGASKADYAEPDISSYSYFDLSASFTFNENWKVRMGIDNMFDKEPPIVGNDYGGTLENSGNTFPATYDPLGRAFFLGLNVNF